MTNALLTDITSLKPGAPITHEGITLIPIFAPEGRSSKIHIAGDELVVSELATPTVPQLQVHNPTPNDLLIPAGKILSGGHQTRVVNVSIVVPAGATIVIPVSCVEAGRWSGIARFADSRRFASRRVRETKARSVKRNLDMYKSKASAQGEVWNTISRELSSRGVNEETHLFLGVDENLDRRSDRMEVVRRFVSDGVQAGQVGVAVAHGEKILGVEVFPSTEALKVSWEAIVRAAVIDADEFSSKPEAADAARGIAALEKFLADVAATEGTVSEGVGRGIEVHVETPTYVAHGLRVDGELVYCNAFAS
ncbi:MAG: ARPP-1 family domain-containing protein [Actinomycetota bacterium]